MIPQRLLPVVLDQLFPVIDGPSGLSRVVPLLNERGGEFCASLRVDTEMVAATCRSGFLPMSEDFTGYEVLLVKAHEQRCVLALADLHVSRSTRRRARSLTIALDRDFERCLLATVSFHRERWLTDRLCASLRALHRSPVAGVRMRSVEVYADDRLVAGEIGYTCGAAYTSMSGFHLESGAGSVQLASLGVLLRRAGFAFWDLGMPIEYKLALGARVLGREVFLGAYASVRDGRTPAIESPASCDALLS